MLPRTSIVSWFVLVLAATSACRSGSSASPSAPPSTTATAKLAISSNSYNFPNTNVGDTQQSPALSVSATGTGSLNVASIASSNPSEFPLVNEASCIGTALSSSATCQIAVKFKPAVAGVRSAQVTVTGSDGSNVVVAVFGTGI
ncbi:MAG TPA: choice-of-anchor D domain-containing protein, partial [Vicinamibacterales bacterium]|nr:choice-of-anchor D domain-containing protein [Vicinamibacterales bacterium]